MELKFRVRIYDVLFYMLLVLSFYFTRNTLCRVMMIVYFGYTILQQLVSRSKTPVPFYTVGFLVFILYGAVNVMLGNVLDTQLARTMVVSLLLNFLMLYAIVQYIYMTNDIQRVLKITELGIFTTAVIVLTLSFGTITQGRLGDETEINANLLAMLCTYGFALSMYLRKIGEITKMSHWFRLVFYMLIVLLTGSRKGLIMIAVSVCVIQLYVDRRKLLKNVLIAIVVAIAIYNLIMKVEFLYNIIGVRVESLLELLTEGSTEEKSLESRQLFIEIGLSYIKEKPWTGYGYDCFMVFPRVLQITGGELGYYSHNNYIELLAGGGIIGFVLYYIPVLYLVVALFKKRKVDACMPYLLAILVSKLAIEYARVSYYSRIDAYIVAVIVGCLLICPKKNTANTTDLSPEK